MGLPVLQIRVPKRSFKRYKYNFLCNFIFEKNYFMTFMRKLAFPSEVFFYYIAVLDLIPKVRPLKLDIISGTALLLHI